MAMVQTPSGLFVPETVAFAAEGVAKPALHEVASTRDGRDITRGFVDQLELLSPQDSVLRGRGGGDYKIYEELLRDDQVSSTFQQRRLAVVSREWEVDAGGTRRIDKKAADAIREMLGHIRFDAVTNKMLFGIFYGYAVAECLYARDGASIVLDAVKVRNRRRFRFTPEGSLRLLTTAKPSGEDLPARKFWAFATGSDHDDEPYGLGLAHWLYWPVFFKRNGIKFWLVFLEKFGQPTVVGKYPRNATEEEKTRLLGAAQAVHADSGVIIPEGMLLELLEAARTGTVDYVALYDRMNAAISKVVVGQTMTTDEGSSRSQAEVHMDVRQDITKADADLVCASFNLGPVRWLTGWNYPGAAYPEVWRSVDEEPDLQAQAEREKTITDIGFKPTLKHVQETYGGEWREIDAARSLQHLDEDGPGPTSDRPAEFREGEAGEPDLPEQYTEQLDEAAAQVMDGMIDEVRRLVERSGSLEEVRDQLLDLYSELEPARLADLMQRALTAAELAGRVEVEEEAEA